MSELVNKVGPFGYGQPQQIQVPPIDPIKTNPAFFSRFHGLRLPVYPPVVWRASGGWNVVVERSAFMNAERLPSAFPRQSMGTRNGNPRGSNSVFKAQAYGDLNEGGPPPFEQTGLGHALNTLGMGLSAVGCVALWEVCVPAVLAIACNDQKLTPTYDPDEEDGIVSAPDRGMIGRDGEVRPDLGMSPAGDNDGDGYCGGNNICAGQEVLPGDCDDNNRDIHPGAEEIICNEIDDNCDGIIDDGFQIIADGVCLRERRIIDHENDSIRPSIVQNNDGYAVVWLDTNNESSRINFVLLNKDGKKISDVIRIANMQNADPSDQFTAPPLVWNGHGYAVSWEDNSKVYFARLDETGQRIGNFVQVSDASSLGPSLVWTGQNYGLSWTQNGDVYFALLTGEGQMIGEPVGVTHGLPNNAWFSSLVWSGGVYGLGWTMTTNGESGFSIHFTRLDDTGHILPPDTTITDTSAVLAYPTVAQNERGYGLAWLDVRDAPWNIYFAPLNQDGRMNGAAVRVTDRNSASLAASTTPSIVSSSHGYGVFWIDDRDASPDTRIYFSLLGDNGEIRKSNIRLAGSSNAWGISSVWNRNSKHYVVVWNDNREGHYKIYLIQMVLTDIE